MSDVASVNLEDGTEVVGNTLAIPDTPAETPPKEPEPTPPAAPAEDADPEGTIEGTQGVKFAPLGAVQAERARRKEAEKVAKEKDATIAQLKQKADAFDEASGYLEQAKPIIETLKQRPDLVALAKHPPPKQEPAGPLSEQEAIDFARDLDLYQSDGTPDIVRAQKIAKRQDALADRRAAERVAPLQQREAAQQSEYNRRTILNLKDGAGNALVDPEALNAVWKTVDAETSANPQVATTLYRLALGLMAEKGLSKSTPNPAPTLSEPVGGGKPGPETLNATAQAFQRASGLSTKEYTQIREEYKPGEMNSLE